MDGEDAVPAAGVFGIAIIIGAAVGVQRTRAAAPNVRIRPCNALGLFLGGVRTGGASADRGCGLVLASDGAVCYTGRITGPPDTDPASGVFALCGAITSCSTRAASFQAPAW
jgi:hypothetical protein